MIFTVIMTYLRPLDEVNLHLDTHKAWLANNVKAGRVILAGPQGDGRGGLVLAACADLNELNAMMNQDSFIHHGVASYEAYSCKPALASLDFAHKWAAEAKFI
nr:YciI family protein [Herbaspirillum sp. ASV7]